MFWYETAQGPKRLNSFTVPSLAATGWPSNLLRTTSKVAYLGCRTLLQPAINLSVLTTLDYNNTPDEEIYRVLRNLNLAISVSCASRRVCRRRFYRATKRGEELLRTLSLVVCGENRYAKTDACVIDEEKIVLLVQEKTSNT